MSGSHSTFAFAIIPHLSLTIIPKFIAVELKLNDIMAEESVPDVQLLRSQKARLIEILSADALSRRRQLTLPAVPLWLPAGEILKYSQ